MIDFSCIGSQLFSVIPPLVDRNFFNPPNPFPNLEYYWEPDNTYILICTNYCTCTMAPPGWPQVAAAPSFLPCLCFCLFFVFLFFTTTKNVEVVSLKFNNLLSLFFYFYFLNISFNTVHGDPLHYCSNVYTRDQLLGVAQNICAPQWETRGNSTALRREWRGDAELVSYVGPRK